MSKTVIGDLLRIMIAEDHTFLRQTMENMLNKEPDYEVVFGAKNGLELITQLQYHSTDLLIMDLEMPVMSGQEALKFIQRVYPNIKVLVLSMHDDDIRVQKYFQMGAQGFISKDCEYNELKAAIETLREGSVYLNNSKSNDLYRKIRKAKKMRKRQIIDEPLTIREIEILKLLCEEKSIHEIARTLQLSPRTIENHCRHLRQKVGASNTIGLVVYALKHQLMKID